MEEHRAGMRVDREEERRWREAEGDRTGEEREEGVEEGMEGVRDNGSGECGSTLSST